jgi:hypothetical protein
VINFFNINFKIIKCKILFIDPIFYVQLDIYKILEFIYLRGLKFKKEMKFTKSKNKNYK